MGTSGHPTAQPYSRARLLAALTGAALTVGALVCTSLTAGGAASCHSLSVAPPSGSASISLTAGTAGFTLTQIASNDAVIGTTTAHGVLFRTGGTNALYLSAAQAASFYGAVSVASSTAATSTTTGALVVTGGIGLGGALYSGGLIRATQYVDAYSASNIVVYHRLYAQGSLVGSLDADSGAMRLTCNSQTRINLPFSSNRVEVPVPLLVGSVGSTTAAPLTIAPSAWPAGMPTADQIGLFMGRSNDAAGRRAIGAGYALGTVNVPLAFGYEQTTGAGYTKGRFFVALRTVTTDTAPTDRFSIEDDGNALFSGEVRCNAVYRVGADQVLGARGAAVADATDAATAISQLNALLARCRAHGLIAT